MRRLLSYALLLLACSTLLACRGEVRRTLSSALDSDTRKEATQCDDGDQIACHNVAIAVQFNPDASETQSTLAQQLLLHACESGVELSCRRLADQLREEIGTALAGEPILRRSCSRGDIDACVILANQRIEAGDTETGLRDLLNLCHGNSSRACVELGRHYLLGTTGDPDPARAAELLSIPCAQGSPVACRLRAEAMILVAGSPDRITTDMIALLGNSCLGADELACRRLAGLYHHGIGVEQDQAYAQTLLQRSCALDFKSVNCGKMTPPPDFGTPAAPPSTDALEAVPADEDTLDAPTNPTDAAP